MQLILEIAISMTDLLYAYSSCRIIDNNLCNDSSIAASTTLVLQHPSIDSKYLLEVITTSSIRALRDMGLDPDQKRKNVSKEVLCVSSL